MELLKSLYQINAKSGHEAQLIEFILPLLKETEAKVTLDAMGNLYIIKGIADKYPCVAAHLDEVHLPSVRNVKEENGMIYAVDENGSQVGVGADDKNGIWMIVKLLRMVDALKVALFVQEEKDGERSGCRGSNACDLSFFDDCKYILEFDRKGCGDWVTYSEKAATRLCDDDFIPNEILRKYEYKQVNGGKTDVTALRMRGLSIPCCNISCGYYNAHHNDEYTLFPDLLNALAFVKELIKTL